MKNFLFMVLALSGFLAQAQVKIGDNTDVIDDNALLELESTNKGLIIPSLTAAQRNAIATPTNSMLIFNTDEGCMNIYNASQSSWKSMCGETASGDAVFTPICNTLSASGTYTNGTLLDPELNYISVDVNVETVGDYELITSNGGMYFSAAGTFTTDGVQTIVLKGIGYPAIAGLNFFVLNINGEQCSVVINVQNGIAVVSSCGTAGTLSGTIVANTPIDLGTVYQPYTAGPAYTGGSVYGITSAQVNGIRINSPLNGNFGASGSAIEYVLSGTPEIPGSTTLAYSINGFACSFAVPVQSGTGRASAVACTGTLSGTYQTNTAMTASNTKVVTLTVSTVGDFYIRTNTVNGIYFSGSATASATGSLNVTLTASGTPTTVATSTYTVTISSSATAFTTCTFNVAIGSSLITDFTTIACNTLGMSATGGINYIKANNPGTGDLFGGRIAVTSDIMKGGTAISTDGLTMAVGAIGEDSAAGMNFPDGSSLGDSGAVYIFTRANTASNWVQQARFKPTNIKASDAFGAAMELSDDGNTLVVGAPLDDGSNSGVNPGDDNSSSFADSGAAYVYVRSGSTWSQQAFIKGISPVRANDHFGGAVSISGDGNTIAVGAPLEDCSGTGINPPFNTTASGAGAVNVYTRSGTTWSSQSYIKASNTGAGDRFGTSVSLSQNGNTLAVGANSEAGLGTNVNPANSNGATDAGAAYVYVRSGTTWSFQSYIKASNTGGGDRFGSHVSLSADGNTLAVSAPYEDGSGIGINPSTNENAADSGAAYTYVRSGTTWAFEAYVKATNTGNNDLFGSLSLSADGFSLLVGAYGERSTPTSCFNANNDNSLSPLGSAYLYNKVSGAWAANCQISPPSGMQTLANLLFGQMVAISGNGKTLVIGVGNEDGSNSGINPAYNASAADAGAVITYTKN